MLATFLWRIEQLNEGELEIYLKSTMTQVEKYYKDQNLDLNSKLEFKEPFEKYDDYKNLVGNYE